MSMHQKAKQLTVLSRRSLSSLRCSSVQKNCGINATGIGMTMPPSILHIWSTISLAKHTIPQVCQAPYSPEWFLENQVARKDEDAAARISIREVRGQNVDNTTVSHTKRGLPEMLPAVARVIFWRELRFNRLARELNRLARFSWLNVRYFLNRPIITRCYKIISIPIKMSVSIAVQKSISKSLFANWMSLIFFVMHDWNMTKSQKTLYSVL